MISKFVREQKRYTQQELCTILECNESDVIIYIRKLKEYGVLKAVKTSDAQKDLSDLQEDDVEIADVEVGETEYLYVFTFVGVIVVAGRVLKCYPKYILHAEKPKSSPNLCVHSSSSYVSPSMLPLSSGDLIEWSLVCHSTLSYQKFCDRHSNHYDHPEELHQSVE